MKVFNIIVATLFFAVIFSASAFAQATTKIGLINTGLFDDEKAGITKFVTGRKSLDTEFKKDFDDLNALAAKIQNLEKELLGIENQLKSTSGVPVNKEQLQTSYNTKADEYGKLTREYKFKEDDLKVRYQRREQIVLGPILLDIGKAMQDYQKQKAFTVLLDGTKLFSAGVLLAWEDAADVTADFIKFYNARPATTAAVTTTK